MRSSGWIPPLLLTALPIAAMFAAQMKEPVTIEAVTAARPLPLAAIWSPDSSRFAYEDDGRLKIYERSTRGSRELLAMKVLEAAAGKPAPPAAFNWQNRNVEEQRIQWFPDSRRLLVAAGGDLFEVALAGGAWKRLTSTPAIEADPKLSPDGTRVAFRRLHDLYVLPVPSGREKRLTRDGSATLLNAELDWVYPEELELKTAYWWSPDSRRIAYLQFDVSREPLYPHADLLGLQPVSEPQRYPRAGSPNARVRLGVVSQDGGSTKWMNSGSDPDDYLARVEWLPSSREVAVVRLNRPQTRLDLLACSVSNGKSRGILSETDLFWINVVDQWRFLSDGKRFLWSSERDGYRHLYLYSNEGRLLAQLTHGEWEVTALSGVNETAGFVYYVSSQPSPLERQLFRVSLGGGEPQRITREAGSNDITMSPSADAYLARHSSLRQPPQDAVFTPDAQPPVILRRRDFAPSNRYDLQPVEIIDFPQEHHRLYGRLVKPKRFNPAHKYPMIVLVYGGPGRQAVQDSWQGVSLDQALAIRGFVVWQMDNRGTGGRGHRWEAAIHRRLGAVELADQKAGVDWLVSRGFIDPGRVGIFGSSYGGFLTVYSLLHAPETFQVGVAGAPVTDWRNYDSIYTERYLGTPAGNPEGYRNSALLPDAAKLRGRLLLVHNFEDDNVLFQNTMQLMDGFERAGKQVNLRLYPRKTHAITGSYRRNLLEAVVDFFETQLKPSN